MTSKCQFTVLENRKTKKNGPSGAPVPASASPWRSEERNILEKKVSQCQNTERGDHLGFFNIHSVAKHQKIEGEKCLFAEKIPQCRKKLKGRPFGIFQHPFCRTKIEGGTLWRKIFRKKVSHCLKKLWYVTREDRKNYFGSVR